jgi:ATP-binding cassette, subfamily B, multidrug efflux pump
VFGLVCLIVVDLLQLFIPRVIKRAIDDLTLMQANPDDLLRYAMMILTLALFIGFFVFFGAAVLLGTARKTEEALRNRLFNHMQTLSPAYFDRMRTGDLMAHATNDITQVRMAAGMGLVALNDAIILGSAAIGFMVYIQLELTLYVLDPHASDRLWAPFSSAGKCTDVINRSRAPSANSPRRFANALPASGW